MIENKIKFPDLSVISDKRKEYINKNMFQIYFDNNLVKYSDEKYLFRDKVKFQKIPKELESSEELWYLIKLFRFGIPSVVKDKNGKYFTIGKLIFLDELLHNLDLSLGGKFLGINFNDNERKIFLQNGIVEEAISSSQIEGALTSSKIARDMIAKGRKAIGKDEKMILNNYKAMKFVNDKDFLDEELSLESLIELQSILTKDTLEDSNQEGRLRNDDDEIIIQNGEGTKILHIPPSKKILDNELERFIDYANDKEEGFTHPFIKASILHFWIGYLHPFCDGNGRTARIIFYWYLLKKGYWGFSYIPISKLIKESKTQYGMAYQYSEQDNNDLSYFIVYIAKKTKEAFKEFREFIERKKQEQKNIFGDLSHLGFNDRQNKLIAHFLKNINSYTNNSIHKNYYGISINTAKRDLEVLLERGFLYKEKNGKYINYFPVKDLKNLI